MRIDYWLKLQHLPEVSPWRKGKRSRTWQDVRDEYAGTQFAPCIVVAHMDTPTVYTERDGVHLDSILSQASIAVHSAPSKYNEACVVPLPLHLSWVSAEGLPLWCCTPLQPATQPKSVPEYWHKRYPTDRAEFGTKMNATTTAGRWKEYRVPMQCYLVDRFMAAAIGKADEIMRLLEGVTHIGRKTAYGYGRVAKWEIVNAEMDEDSILAQKAVPVEYFATSDPNRILRLATGWTSPYWYAPWWGDCVVPQ